MALLYKVNTCCCGCSLRTGALVTAAIEMVLAIFDVIACALLLSNVYTISEPTIIGKPLYTIYAVVNGFVLVNNCILLQGAKRCLAKWLILWMIVSVALTTFNIVILQGFINYNLVADTVYGIATIIYTVLYLGLKVYGFAVVNSLYSGILRGTIDKKGNIIAASNHHEPIQINKTV